MSKKKKFKKNALPETMLEYAEQDPTRVMIVDRYGTHDTDLEDLAAFPYSHVDPVRRWSDVEGEDPGDFVYLHEYLGFSDYSGGAIEQANFNVFMEEFGDEPGIYELYGSHGTKQVAIRLTVDNEDIIKTLAALEDYPAISDEAVSELEYKAAQEQADDWGYKEFADELEKLHFEEIEIDDTSKGFREMFWNLMSNTSSGPYMETGGGIVFPYKEMAGMYVVDMLDEFKVKYEIYDED